MVVKVLITRRLQQGKTKAAFNILNQLRGSVITRPGYISGETLISHQDPRKLLVISTWLDLKHWTNWRDHPDRKVFEAQLGRLVDGPVEYEVYLLGTYPSQE